ncbi:MAG: hypothetical protein ACOCSE_06470 [Chitinivibrionales bacterium]
MRKILTGLLVLTAMISLQAQNARLNAVSGVPFGDVADVFTFPSEIAVYNDVIHGNAGGSNLIYAGKDAGMIVPAVLFNTGTYLRGRFNESAASYYTGNIGVLPETGGMDTELDFPPAVPHLGLGLNLSSSFALGFDLFAELTRTSYNEEEDGDELSAKGRISNLGLRAGATVDAGNFRLSPVLMFSLPRLSAEYEDDEPGDKASLESEQGIAFGALVEAGIAELVAGMEFQFEKFQFKTVNNPDGADREETVQQQEFSDIFLNPYIGYVKTIKHDIKFGLQYSFSMLISKDYQEEDSDDGIDELTDKDNSYSHDFSAGFEKPLDDFWIFDQLIPRMGIGYSISDESESSDNETTEFNTKTRHAAGYNNAALSVGLGLTKGIAQIDVNMGFGSWAGVMTGPSVGEASLTLDFKKSGTSSASSKGGSTEPEPTYDESSSSSSSSYSDDSNGSGGSSDSSDTSDDSMSEDTTDEMDSETDDSSSSMDDEEDEDLDLDF